MKAKAPYAVYCLPYSHSISRGLSSVVRGSQVAYGAGHEWDGARLRLQDGDRRPGRTRSFVPTREDDVPVARLR